MSNLKYYVSGCKTLSELKDRIVKSLTRGNVFFVSGQPDADIKLAEMRKTAEARALEMIKDGLDTLPKSIKHDIEI